MKNYVQEGRIVTLTSPSGGVSSGDMVKIGSIFGVAVTDAAEGVKLPLCVDGGVFYLAKAAGAISEGDALYYDAGNDNLTKTASGNVYVGACVRAALNGDAKVYVRLNPTGLDTTEAEQAAAVTDTSAGAGNAGKLLKLDANGKADGRDLTADGAKLDAAVATTNVGAGDAGKLVKLDANGKLAGFVLEDATSDTSGGAGNAGKLVKLDANGKIDGRDVQADGAKLDAAVATTNGGAGNAGKLLALDGAGKAAGRELETDGAKLDSLKKATVNVAAGADTGTLALPAGWSNSDLVVATIAAVPTNPVGVMYARCTGGNIEVKLGGLNGGANGQPGGAGVGVTVVRVHGL